jgi:signal transduction histidine kinase
LVSEQLRALTDRSVGSTKRLSTLLDELLDLTRIRVGHLEIHKQLCSLTSIVQDAAGQLGAEAAKRGSTIMIEPAGAVMGLFDRSRIGQITVNLLSNAIKYGEKKPVWVTIEKRGSKALIIVQDRGRGIAAEKLPKLFQRFERIDQDPSTPGLGLGLFISYEIVKAHGGTLSVESRVGEGSTFTVELETEA